jgi:prolyl-tRNA editing enzyme YbaK/EbsC (Cys-tRNA(Pro) deacylase)
MAAEVDFASAEEVVMLTGARPGAVALVNPDLPALIDVRLLDVPHAYGGCGAPARTLKIRPADRGSRGARAHIAEDKIDANGRRLLAVFPIR